MAQVLSPQMRQSLELLQAPLLELRTLVQQEVEQNPTLEQEAPDTDQIEVDGSNGSEEADDAAFQDEFRKLAQLDEEWRDYFTQNQARRPFTTEDAARRQHLLDSLTQPLSLQHHLMNQLSLSVLPAQDRQIGELIIGSINDEGYLTTPLAELAASSGYAPEQLEPVLALVQEFDPVGVGARDLRECLLIQLTRLGLGESLAAAIVRDHLAGLGARHFTEIARACKATPELVQEAAQLIGTLEPKPGRVFASEDTTYVMPEVMIQRIDGEYQVILNNEQIPRLHISDHYRQLMAEESTSTEVKHYIRDKVRAGLFLIKSINQRQQTIYNIAREIVEVQREFFEQGISHLRPLTMSEVARILGIHETTVSRAIAGKYMQTPRGTFEMKYFFTPGYRNADGTTVSNKTIKDTIATLVQEEDPAHPLSDQEIVAKLQEKGLKVARRTIAKYRDELKILPSHLRKGFARNPM